MTSIAQVHRYIDSKNGKEFLKRLYGSDLRCLKNQKERYLHLIRQFDTYFPNSRDIAMLSTPGRTEIAGNHTDHENGRVLAAAIGLDIVGVAALNMEKIIRIVTSGSEAIEIDLDDLDPHSVEKNSSAAFVRGICNYFKTRGHRIGGFEAMLDSSIPQGSGLSSSAAFQVMIAQILNFLFNAEFLPPQTLAQAGHYAESVYFNKPSGLMDQMTSAVGGLIALDFFNPLNPEIHPISFDLISTGYHLIITNTGGSHANLTNEYAAVAHENRDVALFFGMSLLREVDEAEFYKNLPALRKVVGDRAILRAAHFFNENRRVYEQMIALESGDFEVFLRHVNESGISSWTLLQNCYSCLNSKEQGITLGLALSAKILNGRGAYRVHGGGFAGTVQAYVPKVLLKKYISEMEKVFGQGACFQVNIRQDGATGLSIDS